MDKLSLSVEEGHALLLLSSGFSLPEKLGADSYTVADRAIADDEVRKLFRELRSRSPLMHTRERWNRFGPVLGKGPDGTDVEIWQEIKNEGGRIGHRLIAPEFQVEISVNEEVISGIVWCLIAGIHPASPQSVPLALKETVLWIVAGKIGMVQVIRQTTGLNDTKVQPRRWKTDDELKK